MMVQGDARAIPLGDATVDCVVTSPPYWGLRDLAPQRETFGDAVRQGWLVDPLEVFKDE